MTKLSVIITGTTGMVGEGVLHECLRSIQVEKVLSVSRRTNEVLHNKHNELLVLSLMNMQEHLQILKEYNTVFFCAGVSSIGKSEEEYTELTYNTTLAFANAYYSVRSNGTFLYISGKGTGTGKSGKVMWSKVKWQTENELGKMGFAQYYSFRPGYLQPTSGMKHTLPYYKYLTPLYPLFRVLFPGSVTTLSELGKAMISAAFSGYNPKTIECNDIRNLASRLESN